MGPTSDLVLSQLSKESMDRSLNKRTYVSKDLMKLSVIMFDDYSTLSFFYLNKFQKIVYKPNRINMLGMLI